MKKNIVYIMSCLFLIKAVASDSDSSEHLNKNNQIKPLDTRKKVIYDHQYNYKNYETAEYLGDTSRSTVHEDTSRSTMEEGRFDQSSHLRW